jgi:glycerol-3-phosphate dehydrogenase
MTCDSRNLESWCRVRDRGICGCEPVTELFLQTFPEGCIKLGVIMNRSDSLVRLEASAREPFDFLIIGGGATGLGAAVEASARGHRVALVEGHDFAKGTSSRSTKLVHGGVRYLAQGNIGLVREALRERGRLRRNAAHLVRDLEFVVPAYDWWAGPYYGIGLKLYDVLAGKLNLGSSKLISKANALERIPTLEPQGLQGGVVYFDGQFDDARLAVTLAQTAADHGAALVNYAPVVSLLHDGDRLSGAIVRDLETGREIEVRAKAIINATGVFADAVRQMDDPDAKSVLSPSQGVHLVLPFDFLPGTNALMVPRTDDGRVLFVVPWHGKAIVGTTDTGVPKPEYEPRPLEEELHFLMEHAARYLTRDPKPEDVLAVYAGLRPLVKHGEDGNTAALSRDHTILLSRTGLVTIVGGKWTTYRKMGEDVIDKACPIAGLEVKASPTPEMRLHAAPTMNDAPSQLGGTVAESLSMYGSDAAIVRALGEQNPDLSTPIHPRLPYLRAEIVHAVRAEMARTLEDALSRRTRALLLDARAALEAAPEVARLMAQELGRDENWVGTQLESFGERVQGSLMA